MLAYKNICKSKSTLKKWSNNGQQKVVVKVDNETQLMDVMRSAEKIGLNTVLIRDAGRTQIASNSKTVVGIGPGPSHLIDQVTGHLKLY